MELPDAPVVPVEPPYDGNGEYDYENNENTENDEDTSSNQLAANLSSLNI